MRPAEALGKPIANTELNCSEVDAEDGYGIPPEARKTCMLRITVTENACEQRWALEGRLVKHCVPELVSAWKASRNRPPERNRVVDLDQVTSIDKDGEEVLHMMIRDGARFVANGLYTKHLLDAMQASRTGFK
jgi:hypothetical protein